MADLAGRLTDRDRHLCRLLWEHRVLTYLVATATPHQDANPAEAIWLPLGDIGPRQRLADLACHQHRAWERP